MLRVLGGEDESALVAATSHWLQLLVAELLHLRPNVTARQHLRALMEHCVSISAGPGGAAGQQEGVVPVLSLMSDLLEVRGVVARQLQGCCGDGCSVHTSHMGHRMALGAVALRLSAACRMSGAARCLQGSGRCLFVDESAAPVLTCSSSHPPSQPGRHFTGAHD